MMRGQTKINVNTRFRALHIRDIKTRKWVRSTETVVVTIDNVICRQCFKCDGTRAESRFRLSVKRTSPFISARASVQSTTGSRGVRISVSNAGYTMFRGNVKGTGYPLHLPVSPSLPLPCVTVCHHISTGLYAAVQRASCCSCYFLVFSGAPTGRCNQGYRMVDVRWCRLARWNVFPQRYISPSVLRT
jgi:hypothetical protein